MLQYLLSSMIDVIIPAYNEERHIGRCLHALTHQTYQGNYRIIVIDNNSTDQTRNIAQTFPHVIVKTEQKKGYVFAIKTGVEKYAQNDIVACTDADTIVAPTWLQTIADTFRDPSILGITGPSHYTDGNPFTQSILNVINTYIPRLINVSLCGMNMAFRKTAYNAVGGFDTRIDQNADTWLGMKLRRIGTTKLISTLVVKTTARRYSSITRFLKEGFIRSMNTYSLFFTGKLVFAVNADYRT